MLRVRAYSPQDAETLSRALIGLAEEFVSSMNEKGVADKLKVSEESVRLAEQKALAAREALTAWRTTHGNIDPTATVAMLLNLSSQLETELSGAQVSLDKIRALGNKDHFMPARRNAGRGAEKAAGDRAPPERRRQHRGQATEIL